MSSRENKSKVPAITLFIVVCAFMVVAGLLYYSTLFEKRLGEMDSNVSELNATVDRLARSLEVSRQKMRQKDETIEKLQQEVDAQEQMRLEREAAEYGYLAEMISCLQPKIDPVVAETIAASIHRYSRKYGIPPELIANLAMRESSFRLILESTKKAKGLMQVMSTAHPEKIAELNVHNDSIFHIDNNIHLGTMILAEYLNSKKSIYGALESYVGAELKSYINDILVGYADTKIQQFRAISAAEPIEKAASASDAGGDADQAEDERPPEFAEPSADEPAGEEKPAEEM